jgi:hypothetical protein|tara:strand:- start:482 stop:685 length:204 start_codon:yes stop_codon:yes gene_type:complete
MERGKELSKNKLMNTNQDVRNFAKAYKHLWEYHNFAMRLLIRIDKGKLKPKTFANRVRKQLLEGLNK